MQIPNITVKAFGSGFNAIYRSYLIIGRGYCFREQWGTYLTPGLYKPMYFPTVDELLAAVQARPGVKVTVMNNGDAP